MNERLIIYHANCWDGITAAWAALQDPYWVGADIYGAIHGADPPDVVGKNVLIVDFSYRRDILVRMEEDTNNLHVYDHHKTAQADLEGLDFCTFDMDRCGAAIVWDELMGGARPKFVDYVQDRDLWKFQLPLSKEIGAYIRSCPITIDSVDGLSDVLESQAQRAAAAASGAAILRAYDRIVEHAMEGARIISICGVNCAAVNFSTAGLFSEVAGQLAERPDAAFGAAWSQVADGGVVWSLRSRDDKTDVSAIAKQFGGGGHRNAAGFKVSFDEHVKLIGDLHE